MKTQPSAIPEEDQPPQKRLKVAQPRRVDFHLISKAHTEMCSILQTVDSKFLTPAEILDPKSSPISGLLKFVGIPTTKWSAGTLAQFENLFVGEGVPFLPIPPKPQHSWQSPSRDRTITNADTFGREILADQISISDNIEKLFAAVLQMAPKGKQFVFKAHKIHILPEGTHLQKQVDTPLHASNHYATLFVGLPTGRYEGGEFVLQVDGEDQPPLNMRYFHPCEPCGRNKYVLFLASLPYQVKPVTSGTCVLLQFDVLVMPLLHDFDEFVGVSQGTLLEMIPRDLIPSTQQELARCPEEQPSEEEEREDSEEIDLDLDEDEADRQNRNWNRISWYQVKGFKVLSSDEIQIDATQFITLVASFLAENPDKKVCFLLTQLYPLGIRVEDLQGADKKLFDVLSPCYEVDLGYAINPAETDQYGNWSKGQGASYKDLKVMTYDNVRAFDQFINDPSQGKPTNVAHEHDEESDDAEKEKCIVFLGNGAQFTQVYDKEGDANAKHEPRYASNTYTYQSFVLSLGKRK